MNLDKITKQNNSINIKDTQTAGVPLAYTGQESGSKTLDKTVDIISYVLLGFFILLAGILLFDGIIKKINKKD